MTKLLLLLLLAQLERSRCSSWDIIRGDHDMFRSEYIGNVSVNNTNCSDGVYCSCVGDYKTFVYNGTRNSAKCLKDENIITGQSEGTSYLMMKNGQCLGVSAEDEVIESTCNKDNLSYLWLWIGKGYLLNLRMLKCLRIIKENGRKLLRINPCIDTNEQHWKLDETLSLANNGPDKFAKRTFNCTEALSKDKAYAQKSKYEGCYQFSDGQFLRLVKWNDCKPSKEGSCSVEFNISAPIFHRKDKMDKCRLVLKSSKYSQDGYSWQEFKKIPQGISVDNQKTLKIENTHSVLGKFPGHLLKLEINCNKDLGIYEWHYVLLKIAGSPRATIPATKPATKPTMKPSLSSTTPSRSSSLVPTSQAVPVDIKTESTQPSNTIVIIVSVFVSLFLLVAVVTVVLLYRRRKRSSKQENLNELENDPLYHTPWSGPGQPGNFSNPRLSKDDSYEYAGRVIPLERQYEYPTTGPRGTQNPAGTPFTYDYATREVSPLISPEDIRNGNIAVLFQSEGGGREGEDRNKEDTKKSKELPFYNTLENDGETKGDPNNPEYNVLEGAESNDNEMGHSSGPVYNVLEEPQLSNGGKPKDDDNKIGQTDSGPVCNVLEGPQSDGQERKSNA